MFIFAHVGGESFMATSVVFIFGFVLGRLYGPRILAAIRRHRNR